MLRGISPLLSPKLLETLYRMGHHDEIIFGDALTDRMGAEIHMSVRYHGPARWDDSELLLTQTSKFQGYRTPRRAPWG